MKYRLRMYAYCGMHTDYMESDDIAACRWRVARLIRSHRKEGSPVSILKRGHKWEIETPEDACSISDSDGILKIEEIPEADDDSDWDEGDGDTYPYDRICDFCGHTISDWQSDCPECVRDQEEEDDADDAG